MSSQYVSSVASTVRLDRTGWSGDDGRSSVRSGYGGRSGDWARNVRWSCVGSTEGYWSVSVGTGENDAVGVGSTDYHSVTVSVSVIGPDGSVMDRSSRYVAVMSWCCEYDSVTVAVS